MVLSQLKRLDWIASSFPLNAVAAETPLESAVEMRVD
jgi:hypothetical protein